MPTHSRLFQDRCWAVVGRGIVYCRTFVLQLSWEQGTDEVHIDEVQELSMAPRPHSFILLIYDIMTYKYIDRCTW
jgi:hypothetical protein